MDESKLIHLSSLNYQKIFLNTSGTLGATDYSEYTKTFNHNLGYIPAVRVWVKYPGSGIWPITKAQFTDANSTMASFYVTNNTVVVRLLPLGFTATIYVRVYYDE